MSDIELLLGAFPRVYSACRTRAWRDPITGRSVSAHQARILGHLDERDPTMVGELADAMGVTASTMSLNLGRLETAGFVARSRDPDDRRVRNVVLTPLGTRAREGAAMLDPARVDALLTELRPEDRRWALEGIALLADAADRLVARGGAHVRALVGESPFQQ